MTADFAFNWNSILNVLKTFGISDFFDIIIVAFLVYKVLSFASNSRAGQLIKGICLLFVLYFIASEFTLKSTSYLFGAGVQLRYDCHYRCVPAGASPCA